MRTLPAGCAPQRPRAAGGGEAANENPDTGSHHLIVEHVNIAGHRFVLGGRVVVVGVVNSNQILSHDFSILLQRSSRGPDALPSRYSRTAGPEFDKCTKNFASARLRTVH